MPTNPYEPPEQPSRRTRHQRQSWALVCSCGIAVILFGLVILQFSGMIYIPVSGAPYSLLKIAAFFIALVGVAVLILGSSGWMWASIWGDYRAPASRDQSTAARPTMLKYRTRSIWTGVAGGVVLVLIHAVGERFGDFIPHLHPRLIRAVGFLILLTMGGSLLAIAVGTISLIATWVRR